ncbi:MAG: Crp/Fnr family transcriptional regulator [Sporichthyaceae bacterium]
MTPDRVAELLGRTAPFAGLAPEPLAVLAGVASVRSYRRGQYIFGQEDPGDAMFVLASGSVKVQVGSPDGAEVLFCTLGAGDCFGELSFLDGRPRSASVLTVEATQAIALTRAALDSVLDTQPAIARSLLVYLTDMVRRLSEQAADLVFLDLEGRLAKCLDRLAEDKGIVEPAGIRLDLNITQSDLASMVGASRPSVNQALQSFNRRGFVRTEGRSILIVDPVALRRRYQR